MRGSDFGRALSGGYVEQYSLDLLRKSFSLSVEVLDSGLLSHYDVVFEGVSHFLLEDQSLSPWERLELTEVTIDRVPQESSSEEWEIRFSLWDVAELTLRCHSVLVDGEALR